MAAVDFFIPSQSEEEQSSPIVLVNDEGGGSNDRVNQFNVATEQVESEPRAVRVVEDSRPAEERDPKVSKFSVNQMGGYYKAGDTDARIREAESDDLQRKDVEDMLKEAVITEVTEDRIAQVVNGIALSRVSEDEFESVFGS